MKLVIIEPLGVEDEKLIQIAKSMLGEKAEIVYYNTRTTDTAELIERGKDADIIAVSNLPLNAQVIEGCKNLKLLSVAFTGVDHIAMDKCKEKRITVCNCSGYSNAAVADLVFGMLITLYRNIIPCNKVIREEGTKEGLVGFELEGKKFGVVGTGAIGSRIAAIARAFGCEVIAYSVPERDDLEGVKYVSLEELMSASDIISLHVPLMDSTKHMINEKNINLMKETAVLINAARGGVVDSQALAKALNENRIAGACIDVYEDEPPIKKDHPLITAKNTILTPHVAFATKESLIKRAVIVFDNIIRWMDGNPRNVM